MLFSTAIRAHRAPAHTIALGQQTNFSHHRQIAHNRCVCLSSSNWSSKQAQRNVIAAAAAAAVAAAAAAATTTTISTTYLTCVV